MNVLRKALIFSKINGAICILAFGRTMAKQWIGSAASELCSTLLLLRFMRVSHAPIHSRRQIPKEEFRYEFLWYVVMNSCVKAIAHQLCEPLLVERSLLREMSTFVIRSFLIELIFDGFHYAVHRAAHAHKTLYRFHKTHHKFVHPTAWTTFYMHPFDLLLSYAVPLWLAIAIVGCSSRQFELLVTYLTYQEIAGHLGQRIFPGSSFAQCIWIPRLFGIQLHVEEHDLHHTRFDCNYSKRFVLWDKVFGTHRDPFSPDSGHVCPRPE